MDSKKNLSSPSSASEAKQKRALFDFIGNIKTELSKVSWTSREELKVYTKVVVLATFIFGMAIYCMDLAIQGVLGILESLIKLIIG